MKLTRRQLGHIIPEGMDSPLKAEKYAFSKMLTRVLQDINEESIPFGNDKKVVAAIEAVEAQMLNLQHVVFNSHAGQQLQEVNNMRLTKRQLKRIIREEYSRLKRRGLITEMMGKGYMINDAMGGPEDQSFPPGTTVQQAADQMVRDMQVDYPGCLEELQSMGLTVGELERMAMNMEDELGECVGEALEYMDIEGSGNFESRSCANALHQAIYGRR